MKAIKISAKSARLLFRGCDPHYIRDHCHASCCRSSTVKSGVLIAIHPKEQAAIKYLGACIEHGFIVPAAGTRQCPFEVNGHLCALHDTIYKPFGCIASPFTLNSNDTLVIRNRYKLLKCYRGGWLPAYRAFGASLVLLFGETETERITQHLDGSGGDLMSTMGDQTYNMLKENDAAKHAALT